MNIRQLFFGFAFAVLVMLVGGGCTSTDRESTPEEEDSFEKAFQAFPDRMEHFDQDALNTANLLYRFIPRIFVAPDSYRPLDFYRDFLPNTRLHDITKRKPISMSVDRDLLVKSAQNSDLYLDYLTPPKENLRDRRTNAPLYGRIYADRFQFAGRSLDLLFLKYSAVFPYSGLPVKITAGQRLFANIIGTSIAWHELDIHGAIHILLTRKDERPIGVLLAQHNHHRLYLREIDFEWPQNNRVEVAYSTLANEPYLIDVYRSDGGAQVLQVEERTVGNPFDVPFLFGRSDRQPMSAGRDQILLPAGGAVELEPSILLLPHDDPLFTAVMALGDRKKLLGIFEIFFLNGPPGMDYYTLPTLRNLADLAAFWHVDPADDRFFELSAQHLKDFQSSAVDPILDHQKERLYNILQAIVPNRLWD